MTTTLDHLKKTSELLQGAFSELSKVFASPMWASDFASQDEDRIRDCFPVLMDLRDDVYQTLASVTEEQGE